MPSQPSRKPTGIEMMPGLSKGNQWKSTPLNMDVFGLPETTGENSTRKTAAKRPP